MQHRDVLFGSSADDPRTSIGLLALRIIAGLSLALGHGINKVPPSDGFVTRVGGMGLPAPELFAWLAGFAEFGCGLLLALGLLTRPAALFIIGNMIVVVLLGHAGDPFGDREKGILFGAIALSFLFSGAGRYSLDALVTARKALAAQAG